MFISFEGGEGAGKSTQAACLKQRLEAAGRRVLLTREPGGTPGAEAIRRLFVSGVPDRWTAETDALLIAAARADHVARAIRPALARGEIVLCDRYIHSTLAYQGFGKGLDQAAIRAIHAFATGDLWPDCVLWIDLPPAEGLRRAAARAAQRDRFEAHDPAFHSRVQLGFAALARQDPRIRRIDGTADPAGVADAVWRAVLPLVG